MKQKIKYLFLKIKNFLLAVNILTFIFLSFFFLYISQESSEINLSESIGLNNTFSNNKVYISGAINKPGVYSINKDSRVIDLIEMAGGLSPDTDTNHISKNLNLSKKLTDEEMIFIPYLETSQPLPQTSSPISTTDKININTASKDELTTLTGIGDATAQKIIDNRPYKSIEDIKNVPGIGDAKFNSIKNDITI